MSKNTCAVAASERQKCGRMDCYLVARGRFNNYVRKDTSKITLGPSFASNRFHASPTRRPAPDRQWAAGRGA